MKEPHIPTDASVFFATFSKWAHGKRTPINGNVDTLKAFLLPNVKKLVILDQPHPGSDRVMPVIEVYGKKSAKKALFQSSWIVGILKPLLQLCNTNGTQILFKVRDFLSVIDWSLRDETVFDYFIGLESINALAGILLRRMGRVKTVVYYVFDYSPHRYTNRLFNACYLWLDRLCAMHADVVWDVSKAMQPARITAGLDPKKSAPIVYVPIGLSPEQIQANPIEKINLHALVYMGTLGPENGPDIAIRALGEVRKTMHDAVLHIVGGTEKDIQMLKALTKELHISDAVIFHGMVPDNADMARILRSCAVGLAPYRNVPGSPRLYADSSKIRAYCASGLPVVATTVPPLGREVAEKGAGIVTSDDPYAMAQAIISMLSDTKQYTVYRMSAIAFSKHNTWEASFTHAFAYMRKGNI